MNMLRFILESYEGDEKTFSDKDGKGIVSSYRLLLVAHNASGIDSWVLLNTLVKELTDLKMMKTSRRLNSIPFCCGVIIVNTCEVPQYVNFTRTKSHIKGSLEKIGRENGLQPDIVIGEIEHSVNIKSNFSDVRHIWEPYLKLDVSCLAFIFARHSKEMQKTSGFIIKVGLTEASLGWKCFGTFNKHRELYFLNDKYL